MFRLISVSVLLLALVAGCSSVSKALPVAGPDGLRSVLPRSSAAPYLYIASRAPIYRSKRNGMTSVFQVGQPTPLRIATETVHPIGVAVDHDGNVYVVSEGSLYVYTPGLTSLIRTVPGALSNTGGESVPIVVDAQNDVYFPTQDGIAEYSEGAATLLRQLPAFTNAFAVDRSSNLYVGGDGQLEVYAPTGTSPTRAIPVPNVDAIAIDSLGHIYIDVCRGYGIEVFSPTGRFIRGNNQCSRLLALDQNDNLYVGYEGPDRNLDGAIVAYKPYSFNVFKEIRQGIHRIRAMIVDPGGNLYVANGRGGTETGNVVMYPFGKGVPAWKVAGGGGNGVTYPTGLALAPAPLTP